MNHYVSNLEVVHNTDLKQFEITFEDDVAVVQYRMNDDTMIITHTIVPTKYEGIGVGSRLAKHILDFALNNDFQVIPRCWFIAGYIERHPEYQELVATSS